MNEISNEDDKPTPEGQAYLDTEVARIERELNRDLKIDAAKVEMFDELVKALGACLPFISGWTMCIERITEVNAVFDRASLLKKISE